MWFILKPMSTERPGQFAPGEYAYQYGRFVFWQTMRVAGLLPSQHAQSDQEQDQIGEFTEQASCCLCGADRNEERFITDDGMRIAECERCGHLYTSPRIPEDEWIEYLKQDTKRSREFTENRLKYGRALPSNTKMSSPRWYKSRKNDREELLDLLESFSTRNISRLHDVGCGVGFTLLTARDRGIEVSGNELNGPAVEAMRDRFDLPVYRRQFAECPLEDESLDVVTMRDFIEHSYHPDEEVETAYEKLAPGGVLWFKTFHIDCRDFDEKGSSWEYLFWNHTNHFLDEGLGRLVNQAGFTDAKIRGGYDDMAVDVLARKPAQTG